MDRTLEYWPELVALGLLGAGVWWLLPRATVWPRVIGFLLVLVGLVLGLSRLYVAGEEMVEAALFSVFAAAAVFCAVLMITSRNPVYSALWFALTTLSVCGLFLLQLAPFLAAATVIVYAGAIVVTFVFVIMLAQQSGATVYDQRSRQPVVATVAAFAVLALILGTLERSGAANSVSIAQAASDRTESVDAGAPPNELRITEDAAGGEPRAASAKPFSQIRAGNSPWKLRALGRSLFGDYLYAVELAGTLLLVATIGAIAIAPRRARGTL